jgi:hypothetical protein
MEIVLYKLLKWLNKNKIVEWVEVWFAGGWVVDGDGLYDKKVNLSWKVMIDVLMLCGEVVMNWVYIVLKWTEKIEAGSNVSEGKFI